MSAETLRAAAKLMRERAMAASDGPWTNRRGPAEHVTDAWDVPIATVDTRENRRHIASWHPAAALAVADWLENVSERHAPVDNAWNVGQPCCQTCNLDLEGDDLGHCDDFDDALAVATAYLGQP